MKERKPQRHGGQCLPNRSRKGAAQLKAAELTAPAKKILANRSRKGAAQLKGYPRCCSRSSWTA